MHRPAPQLNLKHYDLLAAASVAVYLISQVASAKVISIFGLAFPGAIFVFPAAFILSDIITEVYGYALARRIIWMSLVWASALALILLVVQFLPPAGGWPHQDAFARILGFVPRIVAASLLAYGVGEFINSYVLARMKVVTQGRHLWARTVGSTVAAQAVDTVVFVAAAFSFTLPFWTLVLMSVNSFLVKVCYEALATPLVYRIVAWLKRSEGIDIYDYDTDFSPFRLGQATTVERVSPMFGLQIDHVAFSVPDPEATASWYEHALGLDRARDVPWPRYPLVMRADATAIALFPVDDGHYLTSTARGGALRHLAFRTDRQHFLNAITALRDHGIPFEREDHEICESVYLVDPDGHEIEITTYQRDGGALLSD